MELIDYQVHYALEIIVLISMVQESEFENRLHLEISCVYWVAGGCLVNFMRTFKRKRSLSRFSFEVYQQCLPLQPRGMVIRYAHMCGQTACSVWFAFIWSISSWTWLWYGPPNGFWWQSYSWHFKLKFNHGNLQQNRCIVKKMQLGANK